MPGSQRSRRNAWSRCRSGLCVTLLLVLSGVAPPAFGQQLSVPELLEQRSEWTQWAADGSKLIVDGRFEGRAGRMFRLQQLDMLFVPPRNINIPERMRAGQRLEVSGRLSREGERFRFDVIRLVVGETDREVMESRAARISPDEPRLLLNLAAEYEPIAEFYDDFDLASGVSAIRNRAFRLLRKQAAGNPDALRNLIAIGRDLEMDAALLDAVRFQTLTAEARQPDTDRDQLLEQIRAQLPGWDRRMPNAPELEDAFLENVNAEYADADAAKRQALHRRFYRFIRREQFRRQLKPDGSNGLPVAAKLREELPEERALAAEFERRGIGFRLSQVESLSRTELQELTDLLNNYNRAEEVAGVVDRWIQAQENRFSRFGLSGLVRTADEYLFVGERWQRPDDVDHAVGLLKEAWALAAEQSPDDAAQIADRLRGLGWERMHDTWMTSADVENLPRNDIELAIREGRVVAGMSPEQVLQTLGEPARVARLVSGTVVHELWSYGEGGSGSLIVGFRRSPRNPADSARVVQVTGSTAAER